MKKLLCKNQTVTRKDLADSVRNMSYKDRLIKTGSINTKNNFSIIDLGNGYIGIKRVDKTTILK